MVLRGAARQNFVTIVNEGTYGRGRKGPQAGESPVDAPGFSAVLSQPGSDAAAPARMRLLVIQDSIAEAAQLREALAQAGTALDLDVVHTLADGEHRVRQGRYDCVLLDLSLPEASGVDNVQRIRSARRGQTVVVMTRLDNEQAALGTLQRGAQDYVEKGRYDGAFVLRVIRRAMERNRVLNEVDQLREYQYFIATHDALTGLPNRQLFEDRANKALAQAQRENSNFAIGFIDLDRFKQVNDSHGHAIGDALLRTVGQLLSESVRSTDTVARVGGDEFLLLLAPLRHDAEAEATATVQRLREKIAALRQVEGRDVRISASIGLSFFPQHGRTLDSLLICSDQAMYAAKRRWQGAPAPLPELPAAPLPALLRA
jgi:diguanylate cyclase (GGDEF)-like protein